MMKRKMTKRAYGKHSGFSMVEVIIAMAILSIISLIIYRVLGTSSRTYARTNSDVTLQSEAQLVANSIKELVIDCQVKLNYYDDAAPFVDGTNVYENALLIMNNDEQMLIYQNENEGHEDELLLLTRRRADGDADTFDTEFKPEEAEVLANYVSEFDVNLDRHLEENVVEFSFKYAFDDREYEGNYQVYMRNKVVVDPDPNYEASNKQEITQVLVSPALITITPDLTASQSIASNQQFKAVVRTNGTLSKKVNWSINDDASGCTIDENGLMTVEGEPAIAEFRVVATSDIDPTKVGTATVHVKKVTDVTIQAVSGITGMLDGVQAADKNTKVLYTSTVNGWNLASLDKSVLWKLEYRPNYLNDTGYTLLTEFDAQKGGYVNYNTNVGHINANGLLTLGKNATNNYEFRITATAIFPKYGKPLEYESTSTLLRVKHENVIFDGVFARGSEVDLMKYFLSGEAKLDAGNAGLAEVAEIKSFDKKSDAYELNDGKFYTDFASSNYKDATYFDTLEFKVGFIDQDDKSKEMTVTLPAVEINGGLTDKNIVISKGATIDIPFECEGYNITKASQIGIYIGDEKVSADGSSKVNRYLSSYLKTTTDSGEAALGTRTKYVDTLTARLAASNVDRYYPQGAITYRITLDEFYQASNKDERSYIEYNVYVANVQGQKLYIPKPGSADVTNESKEYTVGPANTVVNMYKSENGKFYMEYASRTYVYDEVYSYWKLQ